MNIEWKLISGFDGRPVHHLVDFPDEKIKECDTLEEAIEMIERETDYTFMDFIDWEFVDPKRIIAEVKKIFESK